MEPLRDWSIFEASKEELTSSEKFVLLVIKRHIGKNEYATVSHGCIADETSLSRQRVLKLINSLDRKKWITTTKRKHKNNGYVCHEYRLNKEKFNRVNKHNLTTSVSSIDNALSNEFTEVCKTSLHKDNKIKMTKIKIDNKDFADESATPLTNLKTKELVGEELTLQSKTKGGVVNVPMLEKIWKEELPKAYDDKHYVADLTMRERGQLKNFISKIGSAAKADEVLTYLIHNWNDKATFVL